MRLGITLLLVASALFSSPRSARADEPDEAPSSRQPLEWKDEWARFRAGEYVLVPVLGAGMIATGLLAPGEAHPSSLGRNRFDDAGRRTFAARNASAREVAATASDVLYISLTLYPAVVESLLLAGIVHRSGDVAFQLFMMYGEAALTSGLVSVAAQGLAYRGRPLVLGCRDDAGYDAICGSKQESRSFLAGHVSMSFNSAMLTCVNQAHLPLYGSPAGGVAACVTTVTAATTTGFLRMIADKHWATDVLAGAALGTATGLLYPLLLHYGLGHGATSSGAVMVAPVVTAETTGFAVSWTQ